MQLFKARTKFSCGIQVQGGEKKEEKKREKN